jgi:hypothetical protein
LSLNLRPTLPHIQEIPSIHPSLSSSPFKTIFFFFFCDKFNSSHETEGNLGVIVKNVFLLKSEESEQQN